MSTTLIDFLSGAVAFGYATAGVFFLRFWRRTKDTLFVSFGVAFWLLALNQTIVAFVGPTDERAWYAYTLRVLGFLLILAAIVRKNVGGSARR